MTSETTAAHVSPPVEALLALDDEVLMGVLVARVGGATWERGWDCWRLYPPSAEGAGQSLVALYDGGPIAVKTLPNPLRDDGDAYRMETAEELYICPPDGGSGWEATTPDHGRWVAHRDRRLCASLAVCAKYADHPEHGPTARHLLEKLSKRP